jgi:FtsH-binding integral membrane protein
VIAIQFGLVIFLSSRLQTMKVSTAVISFIIYSMVTGFTLSSIFLAYTGAVIARAFFSSCLMFAGMGLFAMTTKKNLNSWGSYLLMGLWGVIIASVINMIFGAAWLDYLISFVGVALFLGLTAWDTQKIVRLGDQAQGADEDSYVKLSIIAALTLYLDFLNIFLYLLRIFGRSSDN